MLQSDGVVWQRKFFKKNSKKFKNVHFFFVIIDQSWIFFKIIIISTYLKDVIALNQQDPDNVMELSRQCSRQLFQN